MFKIFKSLFPCRFNEPACRNSKFGCKCGKGGSEMNVYNPTPPPAPSSADAMQAWADTMPQVYETQMKYAPLEAQQQLELGQQYAQPLGEVYRDAQEAMYPGISSMQDTMIGDINEGLGDEDGLSDWEKKAYLSNMNSELGTNAGSPIGADYKSLGLLQYGKQNKNDWFNKGLTMTGRQPLAQPGQPSYTNQMSQFTPATNMGFMSSNYGNQVQGSRPIAGQNTESSRLWGLW